MKRIIVNDVSKKFKIGYKRRQSVLSRFITLVSGKEPQKSFQVLKNISFDINAGEIAGIIGENGSGKSTLLRIITGIYEKDNGTVAVNGKLISLINLYAGLQERLNLRDNIFLYSAIFGLNKKEIKKKYNSIIEFSELKEFVNTKIYQFSLGMKQRLAFSVAIHSDPDIMLLDEEFGAGDEEFRYKSINKIKSLVANGATILLVSHNLDLLKKHCHKVIWLHEGKILMEGKSKEVIDAYLKKFKEK